MTQVRTDTLQRGARSAAARRHRRARRGPRVRLRVDLRPLPPVGRRPGPLAVRVVGARGDRRPHVEHRGRRRRDVPDRAHPPGDPGPGDGDVRPALRRPLHVGRRHRRGAQRAHPRSPLAAGRPALRAARGGGRRRAPAVVGRGDHPPRHRTTRWRTRASTTRRRRRPPIVVSAFGPEAAKLAARIGDGLWTNSGGDVISDWRKAKAVGPGLRPAHPVLGDTTRTTPSRRPTASGPTPACPVSSARTWRRRRCSSRRRRTSRRR